MPFDILDVAMCVLTSFSAAVANDSEARRLDIRPFCVG